MTKGPWEINGNAIETVKSPALVIARVYDEESTGCIPISTREARENAALIAAAPELLKALKDFHDHSWMTTDKEAFIRIYSAAKRAIAKAEGRA